MPFANERLAANREQLAQRPVKAGLRQTRFTFDPDEVMQRLRSRILGQDVSLEAIADMLRVVRADISPEQRPLGVCLLMGPTGGGKTETRSDCYESRWCGCPRARLAGRNPAR